MLSVACFRDGSGHTSRFIRESIKRRIQLRKQSFRFL